MIIRGICFTERGASLLDGMSLDGITIEKFIKSANDISDRYSSVKPLEMGLNEWVKECFESNIPLVFIGAMGIAVRSIAPFVEDKLKDIPVIVMDDNGLNVIPVLSGHVGGANRLAEIIADATGANPVLTTATDVNGAWAPDEFAKKNGLTIKNREGIRKVASVSLGGQAVILSIKDYPPSVPVDVLVTDDEYIGEKIATDVGTLILKPKQYAIGIGCKKGKSCEEIEAAVTKALNMADITMDDVAVMSSIDIKASEPGLVEMARKRRIPFVTYENSLLARVEGEFEASSFVMEQVGVDNVCERAAVLAAGTGAEIVVHKMAEDGVTVAIAKKKSGMENIYV